MASAGTNRIISLVAFVVFWSCAQSQSSSLPAATTRGFGCEIVWGAGKNATDVASCFTLAHIQQYLVADAARAASFGFGIIAIAVAALVLLIYPVVQLARYFCGCCGGHRRRPNSSCCCGGKEWDDKTEDEKDDAYSDSEIRNARLCPIFLFLLGIGALILTLHGSSLLLGQFEQLFKEGFQILSWGDDRVTGLRTSVTIYSRQFKAYMLVPPLDQSFFDSTHAVVQTYRDLLSGVKSSVKSYVEAANIVGIVISVVPSVCLAATVAFAMFDMRTFWPLINSVLHFVFVLVYGIIGGVLLVVATLFTDVCAERARFLNNQTGLGSAYLVPYCDRVAPFAPTKDMVTSTIKLRAASACENTRTICNSASAFNNAQPDVIYQCGISNGTVDCPDVTSMSSKLLGLTMKTNAPVSCTGYTTSQCTIARCADYCNKASAQFTALLTADQVDFANAANTAYYSQVAPLLDCNGILYKFFTFIESCDGVSVSFLEISIGFILFEFLFVLGIIAICRGQKRFFKRQKKDITLPAEPTFGDTEKVEDTETEKTAPPTLV
jgi:hypothetical protein